jgi:hypothetical protein
VSIVSPEALGALFTAESVEIPSLTFRLNNLGLNDNHCEVMAQELARDDAFLRPIDEVDLTSNPSIGEQGYAALLGILNQRFSINQTACARARAMLSSSSLSMRLGPSALIK